MTTKTAPNWLSIFANKESSRYIFAAIAMFAGLGIALAAMILPPKLLLLGALAMPVVMFVSKKTEWGLYLLVFMVYTNLSYVLINYNGFPSIAKFFILSIFLVGVRQVIVAKKIPDGLTRAIPMLVLFLFMMMTSLIYAVNKDATIAKLDDYSKDMIIALTIIMLMQSGISMKRMIIALMVAGAFICTISVYQFLTSSFDNPYWGFGQAEIAHLVGETSDWRIGGPVGSPNSYGHFLLLFVPLAFDRVANEKNLLVRGLAGYALAMGVLTILFTYSRSVFLGLMIIVILTMILKPPKLSGIFAMVVAFVLAMQFLPASYTERLTTLTDLIPGVGGDKSEVSFRGRSSESTVAWLIFHDHPVFGVGAGNYGEYYLQYSSTLGLDGRRVERTAHNRYLQILAEHGLVGFAVFMSLLGAILYNMWHARNMFKAAGLKEYADIAAACTVGFLSYLAIYYFIDDVHPRYFWMITGIGFALPDVAAYEIARMRQRVTWQESDTVPFREYIFADDDDTLPISVENIPDEEDETMPDRNGVFVVHDDDTITIPSWEEVFAEEEEPTVPDRAEVYAMEDETLGSRMPQGADMKARTKAYVLRKR